MANYIKTLKEKNEALERELEILRAQKEKIEEEAHPYDNLPEGLDGRGKMVSIVYGPNAQNLVEQSMPLQQAFDTLVNFYSQFSKPTDRNVPKEGSDGFGNPVGWNQAPCYIKKTFQDQRSGQKVENLRKEVPLWLAVDDAVQKGHQVQLISRQEFDDFMKDQRKKEIRWSREFQEKLRQQEINELSEEILKEEHESV